MKNIILTLVFVSSFATLATAQERFVNLNVKRTTPINDTVYYHRNNTQITLNYIITNNSEDTIFANDECVFIGNLYNNGNTTLATSFKVGKTIATGDTFSYTRLVNLSSKENAILKDLNFTIVEDKNNTKFRDTGFNNRDIHVILIDYQKFTNIPVILSKTNRVAKNPITDGILRINGVLETNSYVSVYDLQGRSVLKSIKYNNSIGFDLGKLPSGTYTFTLHENNELTIADKFVIE